MSNTERRIEVERKTKETEVRVELDFDSGEPVDIDTGLAFLDHMLHAMAFHGGFSLVVKAKGDIDVDAHHTVEDIGLVMGDALKGALERSAGIMRYGHAVIPMDDSLFEVVVDVSGRPYLRYIASYNQERVGDFDVNLVREFLYGLSSRGKINLHAIQRYGINAHHSIEALFKALGRALAGAFSFSAHSGGNKGMSTKGLL